MRRVRELADTLIRETSSEAFESIQGSLNLYLEPSEVRMLKRVLKRAHEGEFSLLDEHNTGNAVARVQWLKRQVVA